MICFGQKQTPKLLIGRALAIGEILYGKGRCDWRETQYIPKSTENLFSLNTAKPLCSFSLDHRKWKGGWMGPFSIGCVWPEACALGKPFSMGKIWLRDQTLYPSSSSSLPCHTIKSRGWEEMNCSLPSCSVVLLDGIIGPR